MRGWFSWIFAVLLLAPGCSGDTPGRGLTTGTNGAGGPGGNGADADANGATGGGATTGASTAGTTGGTTGVTTGITGSTTGPPPFMPTSSPFQMDATGMSGLPQETIDELKQGGSSCTKELLYPYEGTVFPAGLVSPLMMWSGAADASYVQMTFQDTDILSYEFAKGASNPGEMRVPQEHWEEIARRTQGQNLLVKVTLKTGGTVSTCETQWRIAPGNMTGSIFYNTYNLPELNGQGAVVRLPLGSDQSEVYLSYEGASVPMTGPCKSCHSVSFDGSTVVATQHDYLSKTWITEKFPVTDANQPAAQSELHNANFGALTPDGSKMLTMGNPDCTGGADTFPRAANNFPLVEGPDVARLIDTNNDMNLNATGLNADWYMWMSQFSPTNDRVVFNHAKPDGAGGTDRRELAWATFDYASNSFGEPQVLVSHLGPEPSLPYEPTPAVGGPVAEGLGGCGAGNTLPIPGIPGETGALPMGTCEGPCYPSWPFFTPDGKGVVFALTSEPDFAVAMPGRPNAAKSELWYVHVETGEAVRLDNANAGLAPGDSLKNYYPTVLPVQVGGYFWVFWTSTRDWGHKDLLEGTIPIGIDQSYVEAPRKRIWVTALRPYVENPEFGLPPLEDLSFPPFYLEGQSNSGNVRAFAALNPCRPVGSECQSGLDCCSGYCDLETGMCIDEPPMCSGLNEKCETDDDCCPPEENETPLLCLGGFCGIVALE